MLKKTGDSRFSLSKTMNDSGRSFSGWGMHREPYVLVSFYQKRFNQTELSAIVKGHFSTKMAPRSISSLASVPRTHSR